MQVVPDSWSGRVAGQTVFFQHLRQRRSGNSSKASRLSATAGLTRKYKQLAGHWFQPAGYSHDHACDAMG